LAARNLEKIMSRKTAVTGGMITEDRDCYKQATGKLLSRCDPFFGSGPDFMEN